MKADEEEGRGKGAPTYDPCPAGLWSLALLEHQRQSVLREVLQDSLRWTSQDD